MNILFPLITILSATAGLAFSQSVKSYKYSPIFYAGEKNQPALLICVNAEKDALTLKNLTLELGANLGKQVSNVTLFSTGKTPYFSPNSKSAAKPRQITKFNADKASISLPLDEKLPQGDSYFWVTFDVDAKTPGMTKLDANCTNAVFDSAEAKITKASGNPGTVYWFEQRIAPYVRDSFLVEWNKNQFTEETMKLITDVFFFEMNAQPDATLKEAKHFAAGMEKLQKLRGNNKRVMILFGVVNAKALKVIAANPQLRKTFAKNILEKINKYNCDGIDIDWEYPTNNTERENFALLLGALKREFAGKSKIISVAANPAWHMLPIEVCDQTDFVNVMTYDRNGEHSTMNHLKNELASCRNMGIPNSKIIMGLPFYSCNSEGKRNWDSQNGYTGILGMIPEGEFSPAKNHYTHKNGEKHFFNGQNLIKEKARYVKSQKNGGVMIWAYDTDVPLSDSRSLSKALAEEMRPKAR